MQSKLDSIKEAFSQSFLGLFIGLVAMRIMLPLIDHLDKNSQTIIIVSVMFFLSSIRSYIMRRYFNAKNRDK